MALEKVKLVGLNGWRVGSVTNMSYMFNGIGCHATDWDIGNLSSWNVGSVTDMTMMFMNSGFKTDNWDIGDLSSWNTSNVTNMYGMFAGAGANATTWRSIGTFKVYATNIAYMFYTVPPAKLTLNIYNKPTMFGYALNNTATEENSEIIVNYTSEVSNIDNIVATMTENSNVSMGSQID